MESGFFDHVCAGWRSLDRRTLRHIFLLGMAWNLASALRWPWTFFFDAPPSTISLIYLFVLSGLLETFALIFALRVADSAVNAGARALRSYGLAVFLVAVFLPLLHWLIRQTFGLESVDDNAHTPALRRLTEVFFDVADFLVFGGLLAVIYVDSRTSLRNLKLMREAELDRARVEKHLRESRLQALQARVDPQFLSATLREVQRLYRPHSARSDAMLDALIRYLRAALPRLGVISTLGGEFALVEAWLDIADAREGLLLPRYFAASGEAAHAALPPMLLLPLVEHALCSPVSALAVRADVVDARLRMFVDCHHAAEVAATPDAPPVLCARLSELRGERARLWSEPLSSAPHGGVRYAMELPYEPVQSAG